MNLLLLTALLMGAGDDGPPPSPADALHRFLDGRRSSAGASGDQKVAAAQTNRRVEDAATDLALQLLDARINLEFAKRQYNAQHPNLAKRRRAYDRLRSAVTELRGRGERIDWQVVERERKRYAALVKSELSKQAGEYTKRHPKHRQLRIRLAAIEAVKVESP